MVHRTATVIIHYQRDDLTEQVLRQLKDVPDVLVWDNGSKKPFPASMLHHPSRQRLHRSEQNLLFVGGVNAAMEKLRDDGFNSVWVLNNDIDGISLELLSKLKWALVTYAGVAAVTPAVKPNAHAEMRPEAGAAKDKVRKTTFIDWVCPLVRVSAWFEVAGFDPKLLGYGCDLDFCYRAHKAHGWQMGVLPGLVVGHQMGATCQSEGGSGQNDLSYMSKYLCEKYGIKNVWDLKKG